jgi:hypothetical protein
MKDTAEREVPVGLGNLIFGAVIAGAILLGMLYYFEQKFGFSWTQAGWSLAIATMLFATFYVKNRGIPLVRKIPRFGVMTLEVITGLIVSLFFMFKPNSIEIIEALIREVWPLLLGLVLFWFAVSLYSFWVPRPARIDLNSARDSCSPVS